MKRAFAIFLSIILIASCRSIQYVPIKGDTEYIVKDTTIYKTEIEKVVEKVKDYSDLKDTLVLDGKYMTAKAWVNDQKGRLEGEMKDKGNLKNTIEWKEKVVYRDSLVYQDRPVEVPVEKEVIKIPWVMKVLSAVGLLSILILVGYLLKKRYLK